MLRKLILGACAAILLCGLAASLTPIRSAHAEPALAEMPKFSVDVIPGRKHTIAYGPRLTTFILAVEGDPIKVQIYSKIDANLPYQVELTEGSPCVVSGARIVLIASSDKKTEMNCRLVLDD